MHPLIKAELDEFGIVRRLPHLNCRIDSALRRQELIGLFPGTYAAKVCFETLVLALSVWDPDAVFTGATAARLTWWPQAPGETLHAMTRRRLRRRVPGVSLSKARLDPDLVQQVRGLRVTHPALTALDLARDLGPEAIDEALRRRAVTVELLEWALERTASRAGNRELRRYLRDSRDAPWSPLERRAHRLLREAGYERWKANYPVRLPWGTVYLDVALVGMQVALEFDGWEFHSNHASFISDRRRDVALQAAGWQVFRFTDATLDDVVPTLDATARRHRRLGP
ncbi:MAG: DUF559 domain-containing protein [Arachnia sp.]